MENAVVNSATRNDNDWEMEMEDLYTALEHFVTWKKLRTLVDFDVDFLSDLPLPPFPPFPALPDILLVW
jgi:hypothetical protein